MRILSDTRWRWIRGNSKGRVHVNPKAHIHGHSQRGGEAIQVSGRRRSIHPNIWRPWTVVGETRRLPRPPSSRSRLATPTSATFSTRSRPRSPRGMADDDGGGARRRGAADRGAGSRAGALRGARRSWSGGIRSRPRQRSRSSPQKSRRVTRIGAWQLETIVMNVRLPKSSPRWKWARRWRPPAQPIKASSRDPMVSPFVLGVSAGAGAGRRPGDPAGVPAARRPGHGVRLRPAPPARPV